MGDGTFRPDDSVTRAQFVKLTAGIASGGVIDDISAHSIPKLTASFRASPESRRWNRSC